MENIILIIIPEIINLLKEIAKVTDLNTHVFTPFGTIIDKLFQYIYYNEKKKLI